MSWEEGAIRKMHPYFYRLYKRVLYHLRFIHEETLNRSVSCSFYDLGCAGLREINDKKRHV